MYFSKILLDPMHPSVRQALRDRQDLHRNLLQAFPGKDQKEEILYRLIEERMGLQVLLLSKHRPDREALAACGATLEAEKDVSAIPELHGTGTVLRFNLLACPTKKAPQESGNSRRVLIREPEKRAEWMRRQGEKYGFSLLECHEEGDAQRIQVGRKSGSFLLSAILFSGILRIENSDLFWHSWEKGIGPEKAYGMGLMLLSR